MEHRLWQTFVDPPREHTLVPFWLLNDDLEEAELRRQTDDFEAHGVYGFVIHPRIGLPDSIGFMSERWLHFVRVCVEHAAAKHMMVILYDEGMYPSGSCAGQVVATNPRYATRCLERRAPGTLGPDEQWVAEDDQWVYVNRRSMGTIRGVVANSDDGQSAAPPSADLLNPEAMACFRHLVLDGYYAALKDHFGKTIRAIFTDEPSLLGRGAIRGVVPWTWDFEQYLRTSLGYDFRPYLAALFDRDNPAGEQFRRDFDHAVNARLEETYYVPYGQWCEKHGVALTGHPSGPEDIGTLKYFQVPGQDVVWRYIEPFQDKALEGDQSTMAKCSSSAQRHYGRTRNVNECFGAYGWEFTYDEMLWVTNWLLVRGVNQLTPHAFYYSLRGDRRNERPPDVGPNSAWWTDYKTYADYCRRLCWLIAEGKHICRIAILGSANSLPWRAARVLFESQRDFNYLDRDTLLSACNVQKGGIAIRDMKYGALIVDGAQYADAEVVAFLKPLIEARRVIAYGEPAPGIAPLANDRTSLVQIVDALVPPDVIVSPPTRDLRYLHVQHDETDFYLFANEGKEVIEATVAVAGHAAGEWWNPEHPVRPDGQNKGCPWSCPFGSVETQGRCEAPHEASGANALVLSPYKTTVLCCRKE